MGRWPFKVLPQGSTLAVQIGQGVHNKVVKQALGDQWTQLGDDHPLAPTDGLAFFVQLDDLGLIGPAGRE